MLRCVIFFRTSRPIRSARLWLFAALLPLSLPALPSHAEDDPPGPRHYEVWAGADAAENVWLLYTGMTLAPFGDMNSDGLRLRFTGGYGKYSYSGKRPELNPAYTGLDDEPMILTPYKTFHARVQFAEALIGYQWRWGELTTKAFVGIASMEHLIHPGDRFVITDPNSGVTRTFSFNRASGHDIGLKGALELWLNIGADAYASLDLSWSDAHLTRSAHFRLGHKILPELMPGLSAGLEGSFNLDRNGEVRLKNETLVDDVPLDYARFGGFARYTWDTGELSASAGLLGDFTQDQSAYGTVNFITKF
jgi:hypothetical protein